MRLVEDTDHDGVADKSSVYADGFNSELDGIASGVLARHGKVWFTNIPSLWLLEGDAGNVKKTELLRGFGVRYNFTGHDFHGLAMGHDGKLYFSIGDRGMNVQEQGRQVHRATPTRARCSAPTPTAPSSRWCTAACAIRRNWCSTSTATCSPATTTATRPTWSAWCTWSKAATAAGASATSTRRSATAAPGCAKDCGSRASMGAPPIYCRRSATSRTARRASPTTRAPASRPNTRGHFFITHFKGSIARSGIQTYTLKQNGATFVPTSSQQFIGGVLPTDVTFGPGRRAVLSDWVDGWPKSQQGPHLRHRARESGSGAGQGQRRPGQTAGGRIHEAQRRRSWWRCWRIRTGARASKRSSSWRHAVTRAWRPSRKVANDKSGDAAGTPARGLGTDAALGEAQECGPRRPCDRRSLEAAWRQGSRSTRAGRQGSGRL